MSRRTKLKYIHGRGPVKGRKLRRGVLVFTAVVALLFVPWQAVFLDRTALFSGRVRQALLGESTSGAGLPPPPAPVIRTLADPLHDYGIALDSEVLAKMDDNQLAKHMADIKAVGVGWVRFEVSWEAVQHTEGRYDWGSYDAIVQAAGARQLKMIGVLIGTPVWARHNCAEARGCPPKDPSEFAAFAGRAAARYQPMGLQVWEVWNEPNAFRFWQPQPEAAAYAKLLQAAYPAIRMANPQAIVLTGGLSPEPPAAGTIPEIDYLPQLYAAGAGGYFDAVAAHPYTYPFIPSHNSQQGWSRLAYTANNLRATMVQNGDGAKKIWLTQFGAPTAGPGQPATMENHRTQEATHVDNELQAQIILKAAELYRSYDWVGPLMWYTYADPGQTRGRGEHSFGIVDRDGKRKPAYEALQRAITGR